MEDAIISMFACGMSNRDIESQMRTMYEVDVSPEMVSRITDKVVPFVSAGFEMLKSAGIKMLGW